MKLAEDQLQTIVCPLCGRNEVKTLLTLKDLFYGGADEFKLVRCKNCSLHYLNPRPKPKALPAFYPEDYGAYVPPVKFDMTASSAGWKKKFKAKIFEPKSRLGKLLRMTFVRLKANWRWFYAANPNDLGKRMLDIGCGAGQNLMMFHQYGWKAEGLDFSEHAAAAGKKQGLEIKQGFLEEIHYADESFDFIWISHVFEHVVDPQATLAEMKRILRPGGRIYMEVPVVDALMPWIFKEFYFGWETPRHLTHFSRKTLQGFAEKNGFKMSVLSRTSETMMLQHSLSYRAEARCPEKKERIRKQWTEECSENKKMLLGLCCFLIRLLCVGEVLSVELRKETV